MSTQDVLNLLLVLGFLIITGCTVLITFFLVKTLKSISELANSLQNTTQNIKGKLQMGALSFIPGLLIAIIGRILKRGR